MSDGQIKVLLIEDDPGDAYLLQELLLKGYLQTFQLEWVSYLQAGLERLGQGNIDVVLSDLALPDSQGLETFTKIYAQAPGIPIVVMSGSDDETIAIDAVQAGAQDYLVKGEVDGNLLIRALRYAIERKRIEDALRISEERYALAALGANHSLWDWDLRNNQLYFSPHWKTVLGYSDDEEFNPSIEQCYQKIHLDDVASLQASIAAHIAGETPFFESEYRIRHRDGHYIWIACRGLRVLDTQGEAYRIVGSQSDITRRKNAEEQLRYEALHDTLTGLPNRAFFVERLKQSMVQVKQADDYLFAVLFLDLDRFKVVNDSLGHVMGDKLLATIAQRLQQSIRPDDFVARLGGDEFIILLDNIPTMKIATQTANRIQMEISAPIQLEDHNIFVTASIGITFGHGNYARVEDLLRDADMAMYRAKARGKARYALFETDQYLMTVNRWQLEVDLRQAIMHQELDIYYQPIVRLSDEKTVGAEALLRWHHPQRGLLLPETFIWLAEETGLIVPLGEWVLRQACTQTKHWQESGHSLLRVAVNVSTRQFQDQNLPELVSQVLTETGLSAQSLELEIVDAVNMTDNQAIVDDLIALRTMGIKISIDDFGLGSSLNSLRSLPLDTLKIDQSFLQHDITHNSQDIAIIRAIVAMAQSLNLKVIVEGVETRAHLELLRSQRCNEVQGHLFSAPVPASTISNFLL